MKSASLADLATGAEAPAAAPARARRQGVRPTPAPARAPAQVRPSPARAGAKVPAKRRKRASAEEVQQQKDLALTAAKQLSAERVLDQPLDGADRVSIWAGHLASWQTRGNSPRRVIGATRAIGSSDYAFDPCVSRLPASPTMGRLAPARVLGWFETA